MTMDNGVKEIVREKYGQAALRVQSGQNNGCCGASALEGCDPITSNLYDAAQTGELPEWGGLRRRGFMHAVPAR